MSATARYREIRVPEDSPILRWIALPPERRGEVYIALVDDAFSYAKRAAEPRIREDGGPECIAAIEEAIASTLLGLATLRALGEAEAEETGGEREERRFRDDPDGSGL